MGMKEDKFLWQVGDLTITLSQCSDCVNNAGKSSCHKFIHKPIMFSNNTLKCAEYRKEMKTSISL